jgi:acyl-CoA thioesterase-1
MYGTNDSWVDVGKTESRLSEKQYETNLRAIVRRLQEARIQAILMTEPRFGEENRRNGLGEDPNRRLARYVELCRRVARDAGVPLIDHFGAWTTEQERGQKLQAWTTDGCHPNIEGHANLAARLVPVLAPLVRGLSTTP